MLRPFMYIICGRWSQNTVTVETRRVEGDGENGASPSRSRRLLSIIDASEPYNFTSFETDPFISAAAEDYTRALYIGDVPFLPRPSPLYMGQCINRYRTTTPPFFSHLHRIKST